MRFKEGVGFKDVGWQIFYALSVAEVVYQSFDHREVTVTSMNDSQHGDHTLHHPVYDEAGKVTRFANAADLRVWYIDLETQQAIVRELKRRLGPDYDVVLETDPPHIHMEFDPK